MAKTPVPYYDACWVCHRLQAQCHDDCPYRLPPDHPSLRGSDGKLMDKNDLCGYLIHFQHGQDQLREMGLHDLADIPFTTNPPPLPPSSTQRPSVPQSQLSPSKRKWSETADTGQSSRSAKGKAVLDPVNEAPKAQSVPGLKLSDEAIDDIIQNVKMSDADMDQLAKLSKMADAAITQLIQSLKISHAAGGSDKPDHRDLKMSDAAGGSDKADHQDVKMTENDGNPDVPESPGLDPIAKADQEVRMIEDEAKWEIYRYMMDGTNHPLGRSNSRNTTDEFDEIDMVNFDADFPAQGDGANVDDLAGNQDNAGSGAPGE